MPNKTKVPYKGGMVDATPIEVTQTNEYWNRYFLEDGTIIKMKVVATKIARIDGEHDVEGNPVYWVKSNNILDVSSPENLKKKG